MSALQTLAARLRAASARERLLILVAALAVAAGLLLSLADWSYREHRRLVVALPAAEARLARMQDQSDELGRLRRAAAPPETPVGVRSAAAAAAAQARGLVLEFQELPDAVVISGTGSAPAVLDWLAAMQAEQHLRPEELALTPDQDRVRISGKLQAVGAGQAQ